MGVKLKRKLAGLRKIRTGFYLKRIHPGPLTMNVLRDLYPKVNWKRVRFYEGLPWFTPTVAPYVTAQALPHFYSLGGYVIYLKKFDESRAQCIADIVHEAFHIVQAMHFMKGYGFGFFRGWMLYYLAVFMQHGYRQNPFEIPAYNQEYRFLSYCSRRGIKGMVPKLEPEAFNGIAAEKDLVFDDYRFRYTGNFFHLAGSFFACIAIMILKPIADIVVYTLGALVMRRRRQVKTATAPDRRMVSSRSGIRLR
jgi:hypothetical protein